MQTLQIENVYAAEVPTPEKFGGPWGWQHATRHILVPTELNKEAIRAERSADNPDLIIIVEDPVAIALVLSRKWDEVTIGRAE